MNQRIGRNLPTKLPFITRFVKSAIGDLEVEHHIEQNYNPKLEMNCENSGNNASIEEEISQVNTGTCFTATRQYPTSDEPADR